MKDVRLYVEKDKKTKRFEVVVRIGDFNTKEEAAGHASYIFLTQSIDFGRREYVTDLKELFDLESYDIKKLH